MSNWISLLVDLSIIALLVVGIAQFRTPRGARFGNATAAAALLLAMGLVFVRNTIVEPATLALALTVGGAIGAAIAVRVTMIQIPAMVAFQHGAGGIAASAIAWVELTRGGPPPAMVASVSGLLGLVIGAATFSGSMVASGKLAGKLKQAPTVQPGHTRILLALVAAITLFSVLGSPPATIASAMWLAAALVSSVLLGLTIASRVGGADMPVLISFLNATAGLAAAFCGIVIQNRLLIACGATVAASGSILTAVMCKAMNRSFVNVLTGATGTSAKAEIVRPAEDSPAVEHVERTPAEAMSEAKRVLQEARNVIVIPGYGMALAQAQFQVAALASRLEELGKSVTFAVHPVAGRMPGHMHVLLAEANVDYGRLKELPEVNPLFATTDAVVIVGACDVVNPAAIQLANTPISGMPILKAHEAKHTLVCNLDSQPGYSGVPNPLYDAPATLLLLGDASATVTELLESLPASVRMAEAVA